MQTTAEYFIERCQQALRRDATPTKGGWLLTFAIRGVDYPVYVSVVKGLPSDRFLISWPLGNKIHDDFFPTEERAKLREYFLSLVPHANA